MSIAKSLPITWLTIRQFRAGKAILIVAFFVAVPVILVTIYLFGLRVTTGQAFLSQAYFDLLAPTVIPLATLILATSALGNEIADHTLAYLALKPISRLRIVLEKYLAVTAVTLLAFLIGLTISWEMLQLGGEGVDGATLVSLLLATAGGILAYAALFLLVSLMIQRALLVGIIYILLWESLLARVIPGLKILSVRHFAQSIFVRTISGSPINLPDAIPLETAAVILGGLVIVSLAVASIRLRRMSLD